MARKPNDPSPYLLGAQAVAPEVVSQDFNLFYRPEAKPQNKALNSLVASLSNVVPSLINYQVTEDVKASKADEARAVSDFNLNKNMFKNLVKNGKIPAGASPHYYNKLMELELGNKARAFSAQWDEFYLNNSIADSEDPNAFNVAYDGFIKKFFNDNQLDKFDKVALEKSFFTKTSNFRNQRDQQHFAKRMQIIEGRTKDNAVMDFTGTIIDAQDTDQSIEDVLQSLKTKTDSFTGLGVSNSRTNEYLVEGIEAYIDTVNDEAGFEYAKELLIGLEEFKLGTGYWAGTARGKAIKQQLMTKIAIKEYDYLNLATKKAEVTTTNRNLGLTENYWDTVNNQDVFSITDFVNQKEYSDNTDLAEVVGDKFTNEEKAYLLEFHNAVEKNNKVTEDDDVAVVELTALKDTNIYEVQARALELFNDGKLTRTTFMNFYNSPRTYNILKNNIFFTNSIPFDNISNMFKDPLLTSEGVLKGELNLMMGSFEEHMLQWYNDNKNNYTGIAMQKQFNAEVKAFAGELFSDSMVVKNAEDTFRTAFEKYGIPITAKDNN